MLTFRHRFNLFSSLFKTINRQDFCNKSTTRLLSSEPQSITISQDGKKLSWGRSTSPSPSSFGYHAKWLRHHCQCNECIASTGQRTVPLNILKGNIVIKDASVRDDKVHLQWLSNGSTEHSGYVSIQWLKDNDYSSQALEDRNESMKPTIATSLPTMEYEEVMNSNEGLWRWLYSLNDKGSCLLINGPKNDEKALKKVGEKISYIQKTIYGEIYDVKTVPNPINIAYTNTALGPHMDLVYYQSPPGLQLLHCIKRDSSVEGGVSQLVDVLPVIEEVREKHPRQFDLLTRIPATFQKIHFERDDPVVIIRRQPHIELDRNGRVIRVNWAPPFEGPLSVKESDVEGYYDAYCILHKAINNSPYKLEHCLRQGEILTFNNQRVLHGRSEVILNGGIRHLVGCYINIDEFYSKLNVLSKQLEKKQITKHVFNGSYYL